MTFLRRLAVVLSLAIILWWGAAQFDLLQPQYHPVPVIERILYGQLMPALAERQIAPPPVNTPPPAPANTSAPQPAATLAAASEPAPAAAQPAILPTITPPPLPTATPTPVPTPTITPIPTPLPPPALRHLAEKEYMLELINAERAKAGVPPVILGNNIAAQLHAEISLENCVASHWGVDGLKPYMRYSLAGGYQSNGENWAGLDYCAKASDFYAPLGSLNREIREVMDGWMDSPGHRDNILDPWHKKVNIGLAWDRYNFAAAQHFEGDYVKYSRLPAIDNGILSFAGQTRNGFAFDDQDDLGVQVYYDPPPHPLTWGQLALTYCYDNGIQVAALRPPLTGNWFYTDHHFTLSQNQCPDPYQVPPDTPAPVSHDDAHRIARAARSQILPAQTVTGPWLTASRWQANGNNFSLQANLSPVTDQHGPGVYTIAVWHKNLDGGIIISEYSLFYGIDPPTGYSLP